MTHSTKALSAFATLLSVVTVPASAAISVQLYTGTDNLPATALGVVLDNRDDVGAGYAAIFNTDHTNRGGSSDFEFARYIEQGSGDCIYWFGADEQPASFYDSWDSVHWLGFGDSTFVDGAQEGSDNFIHIVSSGINIGILQFAFDQSAETATLIASAFDGGGLTFADGVAAIQNAQAIPEPSSYAGLLAITALGYAALRRRGR